MVCAALTSATHADFKVMWTINAKLVESLTRKSDWEVARKYQMPTPFFVQGGQDQIVIGKKEFALAPMEILFIPGFFSPLEVD